MFKKYVNTFLFEKNKYVNFSSVSSGLISNHHIPGSIAPETRPGQWFVIIYGFIFVPVTLVVIRDLGQWLLLVITRVYARMLLRYRSVKIIE